MAGIGNAFFRPAVLAGLPNLVPESELSAANALLQLVDWTSTALGPVLGALLVAASGPHLAYVVNAVTFAFSAAPRRVHPRAPAAERALDRPGPVAATWRRASASCAIRAR